MGRTPIVKDRNMARTYTKKKTTAPLLTVRKLERLLRGQTKEILGAVDEQLGDFRIEMRGDMDTRFSEMRGEMDTRFSEVNTRFAVLEKRIEARFDLFDKKLDDLVTTLDAFMKRMITIEDEFVVLRHRVAKIEAALKDKFDLEIN